MMGTEDNFKNNDELSSLTQNKPEDKLQTLDATDDNPASLISPHENKPTHNDVSRRTITYWLLAILSFLIVSCLAIFFLIIYWGMQAAENIEKFNQLKSILEIMLTPLITLVSASTGFYFGSSTKEK